MSAPNRSTTTTAQGRLRRSLNTAANARSSGPAPRAWGLRTLRLSSRNSADQCQHDDAVEGQEAVDPAPGRDAQDQRADGRRHDRRGDERGHRQGQHPGHARPVEQVADDRPAEHRARAGTDALHRAQGEQGRDVRRHGAADAWRPRRSPCPTRMQGLRPIRSESGPQTSWPIAKPAKKMVTVSCVVASEAPSWAAVTGMAGRLMSIVIAVMVIMAAIRAMKAPDPGAIGTGHARWSAAERKSRHDPERRHPMGLREQGELVDRDGLGEQRRQGRLEDRLRPGRAPVPREGRSGSCGSGSGRAHRDSPSARDGHARPARDAERRGAAGRRASRAPDADRTRGHSRPRADRGPARARPAPGPGNRPAHPPADAPATAGGAAANASTSPSRASDSSPGTG